MKTAILGAGALGSVIGGLMAAAGRDVSLWDLNETHLDAICEKGLRLESASGTQIVHLPAMRPDQASETPDLIILLTKTIHTDAALDGVERHIAAGARVLTLQNGLGNAERVVKQVPEDQVLYGCTMMPGRFIAPGHVASQGQGFVVFRALTDDGAAFAEAAGFSAPEISFECSAKTDQIIWQKAAFNCAMNACSALTGATVGQLNVPEMVVQLRKISSEVVTLAQTLGVTVKLDEVVEQINHALEHHTEHKPSMLQDIEAGRPTEISSLCGEVARLAEQHNVHAPLNAVLAPLIDLRSRVTDQLASTT